MKTSLIVAAVIILHKVPKAKGEEKFECPVDCPPNVYRPVCSRGKSYANLCILKRQICKGKTARGAYDDVEDCPGYEKEDDANGKSVEAIDANGVIFRNLIDPSKEELFAPTQAPKRLISYRTTGGLAVERPVKISLLPCLLQGQALLLYRILGNNFLQTVPLFFMANCQTSINGLSTFGEDENSFDNSLNEFLDVPVIENYLKSSKSQRARVDPMDDTICKINCDPEEYRPICTGEQVFRSECYLQKAYCMGSIGKDDLAAARACP